MADKLNVITLSGSLRKGSYNSALARQLGKWAPEGMSIAEAPAWADLPTYNADDQGATVLVEIQISVDGEIFAGRARARDILPSCVAAYIDAASNAEAVRRVRAERAENADAPAKAA